MAAKRQPLILQILDKLFANWLAIVLLMLFFKFLFGCTPKPKTNSIEVHINEEDSTRKKLEINVEGANNTVIVSQESSQSAVTDYEKAKKKFDQSRVDLPPRPAH